MLISLFFRFFMYSIFGLFLETVFSVTGIEWVSGLHIQRITPRKYLEGFVSLYMIPVHGFGMLTFEYIFFFIQHWPIFFRYVVWCLLITFAEALSGFIYDRVLGFYSWDYYAQSKYKVFKREYTLWTLIPLWGVAGLILEIYVKIVTYISPDIVNVVSRTISH